MIASLVLTLVLAQAEPAPPEPAPVPVPAAPEPSTPAPVAPPAPSPPTAPPVASPPAPPPAAGAPPTDVRPLPPNSASVLGGFAYRPGEVLAPSSGFSISGAFHHRYAALSPDLQLGWELDFAFARFSKSVDGDLSQAVTIGDASFGALQTLGVRAGSSWLWLGAGGGLSIGFLDGSSSTAHQPFARAAAGADIAFDEQTGLQLRVGYAHMLTSHKVDDAGRSRELIGDLLDIDAGLFYRFR